MREKIIGVVGGVGPYAGLYLTSRILDQTKAEYDQDHLPVLLFSMPGQISDRTYFLMGRTCVNPAYGIYEVIRKMEYAGVDVAGICCNTAHAPQIYNTILEKMAKDQCKIKLLNIIDEVVQFIKENLPQVINVGVLSTAAAIQAGVYSSALSVKGLNPVLPSKKIQDLVNRCIYDPEYGIKAYSKPATGTARKGLLRAIDSLIINHAETVILGCTEIPLAINESVIRGKFIIDSSLVLARALIRESAPERLKNMEWEKIFEGDS